MRGSLSAAILIGNDERSNGMYNVNVDAISQLDMTASMLAAYNGHTATVHALRRHGATR
jgi:ankyrin repeat protein